MSFSISRRGALALTSLLGAVLAGCSTARPAGSTLLSRAPVKPANFKLADVQLRWQDNPGFGYQVRFLANQYAVEKRPSNYDSERAKTYMGKLIQLFSAQCVPRTTDRLLQRGVTFGSTHTLVLLPLSGDFDATGANCGIVIRVMVQDAQRKNLYVCDIDSRSGWHMAGIYIPDPDNSFVDNFTDALMTTFKEAGLLA